MKAALEIWGGSRDLFQRGFARETDDPEIVEATMAKPGVVLRRGVGTRGAFKENAELPSLSALEKGGKPQPSPKASRIGKPKETETANRAASRKAAELYDLAQKRREREQRRAEA